MPRTSSSWSKSRFTPQKSSSPICSDLTVATSPLEASGTPAPPPLYHTQFLPSPPESVRDFCLEPKDDLSDASYSSRQDGVGNDLGVAMGGEFGSKLLEYALSELHKDQEVFAAQEAQSRNSRIQKSTNTATRKASSKKQNLTPRDTRRPPSLAATHPTLYQQSKAVPSTTTKTSMPSTSCSRVVTEVQRPPASTHQQKSSAGQAPSQQPYLPPWQQWTDPRRLLSHNPMCNDPMHAVLKMDRNLDNAGLVSPMRMLALPLGDMIEAANIYDDAREQRTANQR